jgi:predicted O-linked N-acetylglucosamine transferase (SPINDLY family)
LREAALADFDPSEQLWRWHATVAEYARCHWPLSEEEQRSRIVALLPAWTEWLKRQPAGKELTLSRLEASRFNLNTLLEICSSAPYQEAWVFLDELDARLPLPDRTLILRDLAAKALEAKLMVLPADDKARRAGLLNNLGGALSALGQREQALEASQEAVDIRRKLAKANPQAFLPDLAMSLNNLGGALSDLGQREPALEASQEAADVYRKLAKANPQAFLPNLAMSLNNLGNRLSDLGQREQALEASQEAVDIRRKLAKANPQAFLPNLAASLNNLGGALSDLGQRGLALEASQEAVDIRRKLAEANPQAFLPDLAMSLGAYGRVLLAMVRHDEAASAFSEGLQHLVLFYRDLPQAFSGLAHALRRDYIEACQMAEQEPDKDLLSQFD